MSAKLLFRQELDTEKEMQVAMQWLPVVTSRNDESLKNSLVIGRYSVLPYYRELENDLAHKNARLINTYDMHMMVADIMQWANKPELSNLTVPAYSCENHYQLPEGAYVLKGRTNSKKHNWNTHMFAASKDEIPRVLRNLSSDTFYNEQGIVIRPYVPLMQLSSGLNGIPIANEWRTFWLGEICLGSGWYWVSEPDAQPCAEIPTEALACATTVAKIMSKHINFFVVDVAQTAKGDWMMIELNDGQMSGLVGVNRPLFYYNLSIWAK